MISVDEMLRPRAMLELPAEIDRRTYDADRVIDPMVRSPSVGRQARGQ